MMTRSQMQDALAREGFTPVRDTLIISSDVVRVESSTGEAVIGIPTGTLQRNGNIVARATKSVADAVVDGLYWVQQRGRGNALRVVMAPSDEAEARAGILQTLLSARRPDAPEVILDWRFTDDPRPPTTFGELSRWRRLLSRYDDVPVPKAASDLEAGLKGLGFHWYGNVSAPHRLSGRLRGLEVCTAVQAETTLHFSFGIGKEERGLKKEFERIRLEHDFPLTTSDERIAAGILRLLAHERNGGRLGESQPEHHLESRILAGEQEVILPDGRRLVPLPTPKPFQFPARWAAKDSARHVDLVMVAQNDPGLFVVELKAGTEGEYLRHAIGQAALYTQFLRGAADLHSYFARRNSAAARCEAVVALPSTRADLFSEAERLATMFGVTVVSLAAA